MARIRHIAIATRDPEATARFYIEGLGLKQVGKVNTPTSEGYYLSDGHVNLAILKFKYDDPATTEGALLRALSAALGVELVEDRNTRVPAKNLAARTVYRAFELGLVVYYVGLSSNVLELTPPLILTAAEADEAVRILDAAIGDAVAGRVSEATVRPFAGW